MTSYGKCARLLLLALATGCGSAERVDTAASTAAPEGRYLFVFAGDGDATQMLMSGGHAHGAASPDSARDPDFLAVIDIDTSSATYAQVVSTAPLAGYATVPHHTELEMPRDGNTLIGNGYAAGRAYMFDLGDAMKPRVAGMFDTLPELRRPHSFARLADSTVLSTMQFGDTRTKGRAGGLVRYSPDGRILRRASAVDSSFGDAAIRTYSLDVAERTDRVLTTSSPMDDERTADVMQLWRLSDLTLLRTLAVPKTSADTMWHYPFETRFMPDGRSAFMNTYYCAFYALTGLDGPSPAIDRVLALDFPRQTACGVPLVVGHWWIMPVSSSREFVVLDIRDIKRPRVASTLVADSTFTPHWLARDPAGSRIVATTEAPRPAVRLLVFDSTSGRLAWDEKFRERADGPLGVSFDRAAWPHGASGAALPHGAVFSRRTSRPH